MIFLSFKVTMCFVVRVRAALRFSWHLMRFDFYMMRLGGRSGEFTCRKTLLATYKLFLASNDINSSLLVPMVYAKRDF